MTIQAIKRAIKWLISPPLVERGAGPGVYLTFDDGPHPEHTPRILDTLKSRNAKATFFMIGSEMERYPNLVADVLAQGHTIGLHSYRHAHPRSLSVVEAVQDIRRSMDLARRFGFELRYYRPPYGELLVVQVLLCAWKGIGVVLWSKESRDSFITRQDDLLARFRDLRVVDGDILLLHDDSAVTADALPSLLEMLGVDGTRFMALGEG